MANFTNCHRLYARLLVYIDILVRCTPNANITYSAVSLRPRTVLGEADPPYYSESIWRVVIEEVVRHNVTSPLRFRL